jgi:hypothetical protein
MIAFSREPELVLIGELPNPLQTRPTVDRSEGLGKESDEILIWIQTIADLVNIRNSDTIREVDATG